MAEYIESEVVEDATITAEIAGITVPEVVSVNGKTGVVVLDSDDIGAVAKETGKGLSTNDYDDTEKGNVASNTSARHTHANKELLDSYDQTNADIEDAVEKKHSHSNKSELDLIVSGDKAKWDNKYTKPATGIPDTDLAEAHYTESEADNKFVGKEAGKGLSTNDYDNTEKQKVADSYADKHTHSNKAELDLIASGDKAKWDSKSVVSASATGTATDEVQYLTINGVEKKLAGGDAVDDVKVDGTSVVTNKVANIAISGKLDKAVPTEQQGNKEYMYSFAGTTQKTDVALINDMSSSASSYTDRMVPTALSVATVLAGKANNGVIASDYSSSYEYAVGDYCIKDGSFYRCTTAITTPEEWTAVHWTEVKTDSELKQLKNDITALNTASEKVANKNVAGGYCGLNSSGKVDDVRIGWLSASEVEAIWEART